MRPVGGAPSLLPFPFPLACQAHTHASHTSFSTAARGFACNWRSHSRGQEWARVGGEPGEGVGWAVPMGRGRPKVGLWGGCWVTWSNWMSCGMASRIWTAIFTTSRGGGMLRLVRGAFTFQAVQPPAEGAPGLGPLRMRASLCPPPDPRGPHSRPGPHSWPGAAAFPRERRLVPGCSVGAGGRRLPCPALNRRPCPAPR